MTDVLKQEIKFPDRLLALANHIETVPPKVFAMNVFREHGNFTLHGCGTVGCVLGHAPSLLKRQFGLTIPHEFNSDVTDKGHKKYIDFNAMSDKLLGVPNYTALWQYLFSGSWSRTDNTPTGAAERIRWVIRHGGVPKDWKEELSGAVALSYMQGDIYQLEGDLCQ